MSDNKTQWIADELQTLHDSGLFNKIPVIESAMGGRIIIDGKELINFCANDYLGLANHPRLRKAATNAIETYGIGPGAVRTIAGTHVLHKLLEDRLAEFKGAEACITFQSGFTANLATIPALVGRGDVIFSDQLNHASIIDGCRLSRASIVAYEHNNVDDLRAKIESTTEYGKRLIVTDGVFSMDGDIAPLPELHQVAAEHDILLMVDDAHGEGVLGRNGRGIVDHFDLHGKIDVEIGTMSKAFGVVGGIVAGKQIIVDWLRQRGRPFLFSSAMTIPDTAACLEAVDLLEGSSELVETLWNNAKLMKSEMAKMGFDIGNSETPIIPLMLGDVKLAREFSRQILSSGVFAMAIGYPTVPEGKARVRVMNTASHSQTDLEEALAIFQSVGRKLDVID